MERFVKRFITFLLAAAMAASMMSLPARAEESGNAPGSDPVKETSHMISPEKKSAWGSAGEVDPKNWMSDLPDALPINQINIPGTHDSGTCHVRGAFSGYASTQSCQIDEQLNYGLRCFDIRVGIYGTGRSSDTMDNLSVYHGGFNCTTTASHMTFLRMKHVFGFCDDFLKEHPGETIILKMQEEHVSSVDDDVIRIMNDMCREYRYSKGGHYRYYATGDPIPTLGEVRGCVVLLDNDSNIGTGTGTYTKYEDHYQEKSVDTKKKYVKLALDTSGTQDFLRTGECFKQEGYDNDLDDESKRGEPIVKVVFSSNNALLKAGPTIRSFSDPINKMLSEYPFEVGVRYGWFLMDFPTECPDLIKKIIYTNAPPVTEVTFNFDWQDGMNPQGFPKFYVIEKNTGDIMDRIRVMYNVRNGVQIRNEIRVKDVPTYYREFNSDFAVLLPTYEGKYNIDETDDGVDADGARRYKISISNPNVTHVKINWDLCPHESVEKWKFTSYKQYIDPPGDHVENPIIWKKVIYDECDESMVYFNLEQAGYRKVNYIHPDLTNSPPIQEDPYYTYVPEYDFERIDGRHIEITIHAKGPYKTLSGQITFDDDASTKGRRPSAEDALWEACKLVGKVNGEVVAEGPITLNAEKYDSDGILSWTVDNAPVKSYDGQEIDWSVEYPTPTGYYPPEQEGMDAVITPVPLHSESGQLIFDDNNNSGSIRPYSTDPTFRALYFIGTVEEDSTYRTEFDVNYDFSKYDSQGIVTWKTEGMPVKSHDGYDLIWKLKVPDFDGYNTVRDGNNATLTLANSYQHVQLIWEGDGGEGAVSLRPKEMGIRLYRNVGTSDSPDWAVMDERTTDAEKNWKLFFSPQRGNRVYKLEPVDVPEDYEWAVEDSGDGGTILRFTYNPMHDIDVAHGTADVEKAASGTSVRITADAPETGKYFYRWEVGYGDIELADPFSSETTFVMPKTRVALNAIFKTEDTGSHKIYVSGGTADKDAAEAGETVTLTLEPREHYTFDKWFTESEDVELVNATETTASFIMPNHYVRIKALFTKVHPVVKKPIMVTNGTADQTSAGPGETITLTADPAPRDMEFDKWVDVYGNIELANASAETTTFVMPSGNVKVEACYKEIEKPDPPAPEIKYHIEVENGLADALRAYKGTDIFLTADEAEEGKEFAKWEVVSGDVTFEDETDAFTSFVMPEEDVKIKAVYTNTEDAKYDIFVVNGSADPEMAVPDTQIKLTADEPLKGQHFKKWEILWGGITLADATSPTTTFIMTEEEVMVKAVYGIDEITPAAYQIIKGDGQTYTQKSGQILSFVCDGDMDAFYNLYIDDKEVDFDQYDCLSGSTIVELKPAYLDTLSGGSHSIRFRYENGSSDEAHFTVVATNPVVKNAKAAFAPLKARLYKAAKTSITIKWNKVTGAQKYDIYAAKYAKKYSLKKIATVKGKTSRRITGLKKGTKLKKGTYYAIVVKAMKGSRKLAVSKTIYISTTGGKTTNIKALTLKKTKVSVKKGRTVKLAVKKRTLFNPKLKNRKRRGIAFESSNKKIATVSAKGTVKGVKKGSCYIYVYAQDGIYKSVKVTVK